MKRFLILTLLVALSCSGNKRTEFETPPGSFADLSEPEKLELLSKISEEFKGDYRRYIGQNEDSTEIQLNLNQDKTFAISFKLSVNHLTAEVDSLKTFQFSESEAKNLCIGQWTAEGEIIRLTFLLGKVNFLIL